MASKVTSGNDTECLFREVGGDLFNCPRTSSMAHCISRDIKMSKGIALMFKKRFGQIDELWHQRKTIGEVAVLKDNNRYIYNLITKKRCSDKPTYDVLEQCLEDMREHCLANGVKELAMPRIACGLDLLKWHKVAATIKDVFKDTGISITIYNYSYDEKEEEVTADDDVLDTQNAASRKRQPLSKVENKNQHKKSPVSGKGPVSALETHSGSHVTKDKKKHRKSDAAAAELNGDVEKEQKSWSSSKYNSQGRKKFPGDPGKKRGKQDRRSGQENQGLDDRRKTKKQSCEKMKDDEEPPPTSIPDFWDVNDLPEVGTEPRVESQENQYVIKQEEWGTKPENESRENRSTKKQGKKFRARNEKQ